MSSAPPDGRESGAVGGDEPATRSHAAGVSRAGRSLARGLGATARSPELVLLVLLLSGAVLLAPSIGGASATGITDCTEIEKPGSYELGADLTAKSDTVTSGACILISANDVVIDGQGHHIDAKGYDGIKRVNTSQANFTVRNVVLENADYGIEFDFVSGVLIENTTILDAGNHATTFYEASNVTLRNVEVRRASGEAVKADHSSTSVTATDFTLGDPSGDGTELDFHGVNFRLSEPSDIRDAPPDTVSFDRYFDLGGNVDDFDVTVPYEDSEVHGLDTDTLAVHAYRNDGKWHELTSTVDEERQTVSVSDVTESGLGGVFAEEGPYFDVTLEEWNESVVEGDLVHVEATVNNTGREDGNGTVALTTDGQVRAEEPVNLSIGEETTVTFDWPTGEGDGGVYDAAVESDQDAASWTLRVADPRGPIWETDDDWSAGTHDRTVSDGVGDRRNDTVRLGYPVGDDGLVSYWPFDADDGGTAADAAGGNDGAIEGSVVAEDPGLLNASKYQFDGSSRVNVSDDPSLRLQDDLAISMWVNTTGLGDSDKHNNQTFLLDKGTSYHQGFELLDDGEARHDADVLVFRVHASDDRTDVTVPREEVNDGRWHHLAAVRDGQTIRLYLDGELVDAKDTTRLDPNDQPLRIGSSDAEDGHYEGAMDELRIYDRSLSDEEIRTLYDTTRNGTHTTGWRPLLEPLDAGSLHLNASALVGDASATVYVETDTDGDGVADDASEPIQLDDGTAHYPVEGLSGEADTLRLHTEFETTDVRQTPVVDRAALEVPAEFRVNVTGTNGSVVAGEAVAVNATVENVGDREGTQTVSLSVAGVGDEPDARELTLAGGESADVSLAWQTAPDEWGEHEATVASDDHSDATTVVVDRPATFEVGAVETTSPVVQNDTMLVNATVENVGGVEGTQDVTLTVEARDGTTDVGEVENLSVQLGGGATTDLSFEWNTTGDAAGEYDATVASEDDASTAQVSVFEEDDFQVTIDETNAPVEPGEALWVNATIENLGTGDTAEEQNITLSIDGGTPVDHQNVSLAGGESATVNLTWAETADAVGDHEATVTSHDGRDTEPVHVLEPAHFTVDVANTSSPVVAGEALAVDATVTNEGEVDGTAELDLSIDGAVVDDATVSVPEGESTDLTLTWSDTADAHGDYVANVSTQHDAAERSVRVDAPANLTVDVIDDAPTVVAGERLDLVANVTNVGDRETTQNLSLSVDGVGPVDDTAVTVGGRSSTNVTLSWPTELGEDGDYEATFESEDDAETVDVRVNAPANFTVDVVDHEEGVEEGEPLSVTVDVQNVGDVAGTQELKLAVDGLVRDTVDVTLAAGATTDATLSWATTSGDAGNHSVVVFSDDDFDVRAVSVAEPTSSGGIPAPPEERFGSSFRVTVDGTNSPVAVGETVRVTTTVENVGDEAGTETVELRRDGATLDAASVTLASNASETVVLEWATGTADAGSNRLTIEGSTSSVTRYVTVEAADVPPVEVEIDETNAPLDAGRTLRVTASVTASEDVDTTVELLNFDGDRAAGRDVALAAGESTTLTLAWRTSADDAGRDRVTVRSEGVSDSAPVRLREPAAFVGTIEGANSPVTVGETLSVDVLVESEADRERTSDVALWVDGTERDVETLTLAPGASDRLTLEWATVDGDHGEHEVVVRAGRHETARTVAVENASTGGRFANFAPEWADTAVDYAPTSQDAHVGGFLWLTGLIGLAGAALLVTRTTLDARILGGTLLVAAARTSTDVLHATVEALTLEPLLALNTTLELTVGLGFLAFAAAYAEYDGLTRRRGAAVLAAVGLSGAALAATNPAHGLVFSNVSLVEGPFTYVAAEQGPLGWLLLSATLGALLLAVAMLGQSFLAGRDPAWRPVGVLGAGLCLAVVFVGLSVFERGPLPQYDYTGAGVGAFLLVATTTALGHGLHRITHDAQRSLLEDLEDPIVIANDAHVVVEYNAAAADLLPRMTLDERFESLVGYEPEWPAPGETTTTELRLDAILPAETDGGTTSRDVAGDAGGGDEQASAASDRGSADAAHTDSGRPEPRHDEPSRGPDAEREPRARGDAEPSDAADDAGQSAPASDAGDAPDVSPTAAPEAREPTGSDPAPADVHFLVRTTSVTADTGDALGYTVRFTDVSELKHRTEELSRKNAQLEQVASTMSHDLRNPLTVADGYLEIAKETVQAAGEEVPRRTLADHLEPVRESLGRMDAIIEDILALARSNDPVTETEPVRFAEVVEDAWGTVDTGAATLFVESDGRIDADRLRFQRVLENLFRNAVEHVGADVAVLVGVTPDGFYVADDGPGIPADQRGDVFEQGFTNSADGTGLGLSIVSQLARAHGWSVRVDPQYDRGARFVFEGCDVDLDDARSDARDDAPDGR